MKETWGEEGGGHTDDGLDGFVRLRLQLLGYPIEISLEVPVWTFRGDVEQVLGTITGKKERSA